MHRIAFSPRIKRLNCGGLISLLVLLTATLLARSQQESQAVHFSASHANAMLVGNTPTASRPVASEIVLEGLESYGHFNPFGAVTGARLFTVGVEYDRNVFGHFKGAQFDYTAEVLPVVLLKQAKTATDNGVPTTAAQDVVHGVAVAPVGFRILLRDNRRFKPYFLGKFGMVGFTQKALSQNATYENFYVQSGVGVQVRMTERLDLRLGLFSFCHISNANVVRVNPGLDLMSATLGLSYHLRHRRTAVD